jgi:signal transduction histidine kinase/HAMP domain-containing protein
MSDLTPPDLPSTAERPAIQPARKQRPFGVRLWLALMFAAIGILTGTSVYLFVSQSSEGAVEGVSEDVAVGRTFQLREALTREVPDEGPLTARTAPGAVLAENRSENYRPWLFAGDGRLVTRSTMLDVDISQVPNYEEAVRSARGADPYIEALPNARVLVALPVIKNGRVRGVLLALGDRPQEVRTALQALRGKRLTALALAVVVAAIIGFLVASLITTRVKRLAGAAGRIAQGDLAEPLRPRGRDEIGDLGRALESMRLALAETFDALASERDRLNAVFVSLEDAVIVVGSDGDVRFANPAASEFITANGQPVEALRPWLRRASHRGSAESDHVSIDDRVVAIGARHLPAESAVLVVVRDRTEELRRDQAEREFVSNAAHELRNPIAGMSGAIEVLRSGAKDDPEAREHFLERLANDVDRVSRLTKSLLTLARMEAIGEGEAEVVSVELVISESVATVEPPSDVELELDVEQELAAAADPVLLRQVLVGLLTNAYKHTVPPGVVRLRAHRDDGQQIVISVEDTGMGIPAEERDRVFERFYRGSGSLEREGFGLGLAIAKRMIDVMGGEITVDSEEGRGSVFTIRLREATPSPTPVA